MRFYVIALAMFALPGCFSPFEGLSGDRTRGELGRTEWSISDGLCPGLGGHCALDVPLAVGARVSLQVDGVDGAPLTANITGAVAANGEIDVDPESASMVPIVATAPGTGRIEISDPNGLVDRVSMPVRQATRLDCGLWPTNAGAVQWELEGLNVSTELTVPRGMVDGRPYLVCRAADGGGPLLSADAIRWERMDGEEVLDVRSDFDFTDDGRATGARIQYEGLTPGVSHVRVSIGDVEQMLTITVE